MDELLRELLDRIAAILGTDTAAFLLLDEVAGDLVAQAAKGIEEEVERGVRIPVGRGFAGRIAAERRPSRSRTSTTRTSSTRSCARRASARCSACRCSSRARDRGAARRLADARHFDRAGADLLQLAADRAAIAIEHARLHAQRHVVEALQRAMLPRRCR